MRVAICQIDPTPGDIEANVQRIMQWAKVSADQGADLAVFPELALTGSPCYDLMLDRQFLGAVDSALKYIQKRLPPISVILGAPAEDGGRGLYNSAYFLEAEGQQVRHKAAPCTSLGEERYFQPGTELAPIAWQGKRLGVLIGAIWGEEQQTSSYISRTRRGPESLQTPLRQLMQNRPDLLICLGNLRFSLTGHPKYEEEARQIAQRTSLPLIYVNQVGGNDELIYAGSSLIVDPEGRVLTRAASFEEDLVVCDLDSGAGTIRPKITGEEELAARAVELGIKDYVHKSDFTDVVLNLSGGIDSALTACLAARALGPEHVHTLGLPSQYSSPGSITDAKQLAANLGIEYRLLPIRQAFASFCDLLSDSFQGLPEDVTEENLQARIRGMVLMAFSNKFGWLPLATGNKSEAAVGYATLYGDMAGSLAPIGDLYKQKVYALARWLNGEKEVIPESTITKPPSAELKPGQTDQDSLPEYEVLDAILELSIEGGMSLEEIAARGYDKTVVADVLRRLRWAEFKRRQAAPALYLTKRPLAAGIRLPLVGPNTISEVDVQ